MSDISITPCHNTKLTWMNFAPKTFRKNALPRYRDPYAAHSPDPRTELFALYEEAECHLLCDSQNSPKLVLEDGMNLVSS